MLFNILTCSGQPFTTKNYLAPNVNTAEVEQPWITEHELIWQAAKWRFVKRASAICM